jgi:hypothetical protein
MTESLAIFNQLNQRNLMVSLKGNEKHIFEFQNSVEGPLKRYANFIRQFHNIKGDKLLQLFILYYNQLLLQIFNIKSLTSLLMPSVFFSAEL